MFFKTLSEILATGYTAVPLSWWSFAVFTLSFMILFMINVIKRLNPGLKDSRVIWALTAAGLPALIIGGEKFIEFSLDPSWTGIWGFIKTMSPVLLWLAGGKLTVDAIRIFIWNGVVRRNTKETVPKILTNFVSGIVWLFTIYFIMTLVFDLKVTGLVVSSGIIAGVLGLSMQSILSDLIAGIALAIEKPYRIGDWIEFQDGTLGEVTDINWRTTRLLSWKNSVYVVPNGRAMQATVHNFSLPEKKYKTIFHVSISPDVDPDTARRILLEAALSCDTIIKDPPPVIRLVDIEKRPYRYMISAAYTDYPSHFAGRDRLMIGIWNSFRKTGIEPAGDTSEVFHSPLRESRVSEPVLEELLAGTNIFRTLSGSEIETLAQNAEIQMYRGGELISREGDRDTSLILVTAGVVAVSHISPDGTETELSRFGLGESLGEASMLTGEPRNSDINAVTDCQIVKISGECMEEVIKGRPELLQDLADIMARRRLEHESKLNEPRAKSTSELLSTYASEMISSMKNFFRM